jgi:hypothetical protein
MLFANRSIVREWFPAGASLASDPRRVPSFGIGLSGKSDPVAIWARPRLKRSADIETDIGRQAQPSHHPIQSEASRCRWGISGLPSSRALSGANMALSDGRLGRQHGWALWNGVHPGTVWSVSCLRFVPRLAPWSIPPIRNGGPRRRRPQHPTDWVLDLPLAGQGGELRTLAGAERRPGGLIDDPSSIASQRRHQWMAPAMGDDLCTRRQSTSPANILSAWWGRVRKWWTDANVRRGRRPSPSPKQVPRIDDRNYG